MSQIAYNPAELEINRVYFERLHRDYLERYKNERFAKNATKMKIIMQDLVYGFITNISNAYSYGINYKGKQKNGKTYPKWIRETIQEKIVWEQFFRLDRQSLLYTFLVDGEIKTKAYNAGRFYIDYDINGKPIRWVLRTGFSRKTTGSEDYTILYHFKKFEIESGVGTIKSFIAETDKNETQYQGWDKLPLWDSEEWKNEELEIGIYKITPTFNAKKPPFVLLGDNILQGEVSNLIDLENETVAGDAYAILGLILSVLYKIIVSGNFTNESEWNEFATNFGLQHNLAKVPQGANVNMLDLKDNTNAENYKKYFKGILRTLLQGDGGDPSAMFEDFKVESGVSRQLQMQNIEVVRARYTAIYLEKEWEWWGIVKDLKKSESIPEDITFNPLPIGSTKSEFIEIQRKEIENVKLAFNEGVITRQEKIDIIRDILKLDSKTMEEIDKTAQKTMMITTKRFEDDSEVEQDEDIENTNNEEMKDDINN